MKIIYIYMNNLIINYWIQLYENENKMLSVLNPSLNYM